jgi:hypothetical protein
MTIVLYDYIRENGIFYVEKYKISFRLFILSLIYATIMIVRLIISFSNIENNHFVNTKIPAYFHLVLALFIFIVSRYYHLKNRYLQDE